MTKGVFFIVCCELKNVFQTCVLSSFRFLQNCAFVKAFSARFTTVIKIIF